MGRWWCEAGTALLAGVVATGGAADARADDAGGPVEYAIAPGGLQLKTPAGTRDVALPDCEASKAIARDGSRVYVACGASGIVVLDATDPQAPKVSSRISTDGDAVGFHDVGGKVWVEIARVEARPVASLARAWAPIQDGRTGREPAGALPGEPAQPARPSLIAPPRRGGSWELAADTRLFLALGTIGFGALSSAGVTHRFESPVAISAELAPLGFGVAKRGTIGTAAAHAIVSLDTHLFEAGLGLGGATLNDPSGSSDTSISFAQHTRIGARDGLSLTLRSNIIVDRDEFELGSFAGVGQIPLNPRWWLLIRGGGGPIGFAYGDLGIRHLLRGDLGPGSLLLIGTVGGAAIFKQRACNDSATPCNDLSATYAGPALGLGLEWRL